LPGTKGEGEEIGLERVREAHHALDVACADGRADVQIGDLHDAQALERGRQALDRDLDFAQARPAQGGKLDAGNVRLLFPGSPFPLPPAFLGLVKARMARFILFITN
jgi:hypothetical protein